MLYAGYGMRKEAENVYERLRQLDPDLAKQFFSEHLLPKK
jgi:hypothetical protein